MARDKEGGKRKPIRRLPRRDPPQRRAIDDQNVDPDEAGSARIISRKSLRGEMLKRGERDRDEKGLAGGQSSEEDLVVGTVTRMGSGNIHVDTYRGVFVCKLRGAFKQFEVHQRSIIAVGDRVKVLPGEGAEGVVAEVLPRRTKLSRSDPQLKSAEKVLVANIDQVVVVVSVKEPPLRTRLIDRYLVTCEKAELDAVICVNKIDLADDDGLRETMAVYSGLGHGVIFTSVVDGRGVDQLKKTLADKTSVLTGHSGAGKSSLLTLIQPGLDLPSAPVTGYGRGRHRTSTAELIRLDFGGYVMDTPGIREFGLWRIEPGEIEACFREIAPLVADCKFPDCRHVDEPDCAVIRAVEEGRIAGFRYESYLLLLKELFDRREY